MRYFINDVHTLASLDTTGAVCAGTPRRAGCRAADITPQELAGPGWRPVGA